MSHASRRPWLRRLGLSALALALAELTLRIACFVLVDRVQPFNCGVEPTLARLHFAYSNGMTSMLPNESDRVMQHDARRGYKHRANLRDAEQNNMRASSNRVGARGTREVAARKAPGSLRVVALGDSQTFGEGVTDAETWPEQLQQRASHLEVVNLGERGYAHDQMYFALLDSALPLSPDVVVVGFFEADVWRNTREYYCYEKPRFRRTGTEWDVENVPVPTPSEVKRRYMRLPLIYGVPKALYNLWSDPSHTQVIGGEEEAVEIFGRMRRATEQAGARLLIVDLPEHMEHPPEMDSAFRRVCKRSGAQCLQTAPLFREVAGTSDAMQLRQRFLRPNDIHYAAAGHAVIAQAVAEALQAAPR